MRLDCWLVENLLVSTRTKAKDLIKENKVLVDNKITNKPGLEITSQEVKVLEDEPYVSRSAKKLKNFFAAHGFNLKGKTALDIGSSTGGFVQVLLEYGAKRVTAVDVGKDQLHKKLRDDSRVDMHEQTDIRSFETNEKFDIVTCDASFISLNNILDSIKRVSGSDIILLFKPQFEVGVEAKRDKKGVIKEQKIIDEVLEKFIKRCEDIGFRLKEKEKSSVLGREGNQEFILYFKVDLVDGKE